MKNKILLIDAFGQIFRSYYALEKTGLSTSSGEKTFAIYGFFKSLVKAVKEINPTQVIITLDSPGGSFRNELYEKYKAQRKETPEDLKKQIVLFCHILQESGFPHLKKEGLEADDIIATLTHYYEKKGDEIYILSSDKDLCQLVSEHVKAMRNPSNMNDPFKIFDIEGVKEKFDVYPHQIIDYLSLVGDVSDNVPGVTGIGAKGASKLLNEYESLENIYQNIEQIPDTLKVKLINDKEKAEFGKQLISLKVDESLLNHMERLVLTSKQIDQLKQEFIKIDFKNSKDLDILYSVAQSNQDSQNAEISLFDDPQVQNSEKISTRSVLLQDAEVDKKNPSKKEKLPIINDYNEKEVVYKAITTLKELEELKKRILTEKKFVFDTETTGLNVFDSKLLGISFCLQEKEAFYIPFAHNISTEFSLLDFINHFQEIFADEEVKKIGHNLKYDYKVLTFHFKELKGFYFDTMIASYLLDPDFKRYNMDLMAEKYLEYHPIKYEQLVNSKDILHLGEAAFEDVVVYSCEDADITMRLYHKLKNYLVLADLQVIFETLEMPLIPILAQMELTGIGVDPIYFKNISGHFQEKIKEIELLIYEEAGENFNLNSPKQVGNILYEKLKLNPYSYQKSKSKSKKAFSTDEETLLMLNEFSIVNHILQYRKYFKLFSTYIVPLPLYALKDPLSRIHTNFNQTGTATGRFSSSEPNLQNIPIRDEIGKEIRTGFVAQKDHVFIGLDYSQIELRLMAHFSGDPHLIEAFERDEDVHGVTASRIFNIPVQEVDTKKRTIAKTINFGIIYGMGAIKLSKELSISLNEAKSFIAKYFEEFKEVAHFIDQTKKKSHDNEYVTTILGRKRLLEGINGSFPQIIALQERIAVNTIIQGSNADLIKKCMIEWDSYHEYKKDSQLILQIHDELIFEVRESQSEKIGNILKDIMENVYSLRVPLKVSVNQGKNWGELK